MKPLLKPIITSTQNPRIKDIVKLREHSRHRRKSMKFVVEGVREFKQAIAGGFEVLQIFVNDKEADYFQKDWPHYITNATPVASQVYGKLAVRESTSPFISVFRTKPNEISQLTLDEQSILLILDGVEKPGNVGAMIRTLNGLGGQGLIVLGDNYDFYNPNIIRASLGSVFTTACLSLSHGDLVAFLSDQGVKCYFARLAENAIPLNEVKFEYPCALFLGSEANGITADLSNIAGSSVMIPQFGSVDSLNVANAASILLYEAKRQLD